MSYRERSSLLNAFEQGACFPRKLDPTPLATPLARTEAELGAWIAENSAPFDLDAQ
jgi:hypothetical protein